MREAAKEAQRSQTTEVLTNLIKEFELHPENSGTHIRVLSRSDMLILLKGRAIEWREGWIR